MKISIVSTLYRSSPYIDEFYRRVKATVTKLGLEHEIILVNDGSPDNSLEIALNLQQSDSALVIVDLSRNFGHHKAIMTGLKVATGDYIYLIDSDLEENPEILELFWSEMQTSNTIDVVFGIQESRKGGIFERASGKWFYRIFSLLADIDYPHDTLTARLMKKKYVDGVLSFPEKSLEIWGVFVLTGFNQKGVKVKKGNKGSSTYTFRKKLRMALESITSFSHKPLYLIFLLGLIVTSLAVVNIGWIIFKRIKYDEAVEGWASILASIWLVGGIVIFILGVIGIYLSKMFVELKNRPLTIIKDIYKK